MSATITATSSLDAVLEKLNHMTEVQRKKGYLFEKLIKLYLEMDSVYSNRFKNVWLWSDEFNPAKEKGQTDYGIDLVAEENDGRMCAIQCKFYARNNKVNKKELDSFLEASSRKKFNTAIFVYTGRALTKQSMDAIVEHECQFLDYPTLTNSSIKWGSLFIGKPKKILKYKLLKHQKEAKSKVLKRFESNNRGKMIMACGTGKTMTTLKIAEELVGVGGIVLYLVPSISLMQQSIREWAEQSDVNFQYVGVCSDTHVGNDDEDASLSEMEIPVTTDKNLIANEIKTRRKNAMMVIFSTYQSIMQVSKAQKNTKVPFDLIICDEAHRTTGATESGTNSSYFVAVHNDDIIRAKKRLYTTATEKIYTSTAKSGASSRGIRIISMDDKKIYGNLFHRLTFSEAISQSLLSDYKVLVMDIGEEESLKTVQNLVDKSKSELNINDATKMMGCWKGLKEFSGKSDIPLQKAIAFSRSIRESKKFSKEFPEIVGESDPSDAFCSSLHVDGSNNALERRNRLNWLEESDSDKKECRVLSNAKCLTEGVDVPALDAVIFLNPKNSIIEVIQAVGRVLRKTDSKKYGYIILPIGIPPGMDANSALDDNKTYKVVWQVLRALRSHDDRIDQNIINGEIPANLYFHSSESLGGNIDTIGKKQQIISKNTTLYIFMEHIRSKLVTNVSNRRYLESWAEDTAKIVDRIQVRITSLGAKNDSIQKELDSFYLSLQKIINDSITKEEAADMLAQHMIMGRVFDTIFKGSDFTKNNPVAQVLNKVLDTLKGKGLEAEMEELEGFYKEVEVRVRHINTHEGRQRTIYELYDKFFKFAFPKTAKRLGMVYTPIEIVDFILRSTDWALRENFGKGLTDKNVHIIDPFSGTGSFLARLMSDELNLIKDKDLVYKYQNELHATEIILLAYYISAVNCESTFVERIGKNKPFKGLVLADTFHTKNMDDRWNEGLFSETQKGIERQRKTPITAIIGNPPYSFGQEEFEDQTQNISYPELETMVDETYIRRVKEIDKDIRQTRGLYDSYVMAIRWASNRLADSGVIAFVTNGSFIRSEVGAGIRACFEEDFTDVYCFDLRGNQRTKGEISKKEGGKIFGIGSRAPIAITILVKNPEKKNCIIHYKDIGDYVSREGKIEIIRDAKLISNVNTKVIIPDKHYDWVDHRTDEFSKYTPIGRKPRKLDNGGNGIFNIFSRCVGTSRDTWAYNSSKKELGKNMKRHINYCTKQNPNNPKFDPKQAQWSSGLSNRLKKSKPKFDQSKIRIALYRPFFKQYMYFDEIYNETQLQIPKFFPENYSKNLVICIPAKGKIGIFSTLIADVTPDYHIIEQSQCFPLYIYENGKDKKLNITDTSLEEYRQYYNNQKISKKDIFYYIYGLFHHLGYKEKFANNLSKELPRIPLAPNFKKFSDVGKELIDLHLNFEICKRYDLGNPKNHFINLEKISFGKIKRNGKTISDQTNIKINGIKVFDNIPQIKYQVNGRTPLEWIMDMYKIKIYADSGITKNPCKGMAKEKTIAMVERMIYIGVESDKIIAELSKEEFEPDDDWIPRKTGIDSFVEDSSA